MRETVVTSGSRAAPYPLRMHARSPTSDGPSPTAIADLILVIALIGVLTGLAWGVIWVQNAAAADTDASRWLGALPPAIAALCGGALLGVRRVYGSLPKLRRFLTRTGYLGLVGAGVLAVLVSLIVLG